MHPSCIFFTDQSTPLCFPIWFALDLSRLSRSIQGMKNSSQALPANLLLLALLLFSLLMVTPAARSESSAGRLQHFEGPTGSRDYYLHTPNGRSDSGDAAWPLVMVLHGCTESAESIAADTGFNALADAQNFAVIYPQQDSLASPLACWNWYAESSQSRATGELAILAGIAEQVKANYHIDATRVFVTGISAGSAMSANLLACYPDIFTGAGLHSGLMYKASSSPFTSTQATLFGGLISPLDSAQAAISCASGVQQIVNAVVLWGTFDTSVNTINSKQTIESITDFNQQEDPDQSLNVLTEKSATSPGGLNYTTRTFGSPMGAHILEVQVEGLAHAWSGAARLGPYADPRGPSATELIWNFLNNQTP